MKGGGTLGVLQRFERRLEGMVEGAFARAFRSELQPVEVASAVQREMDDRAAIVAKGRTLVPNDFVVELSETDHERLDVYAESLGVSEYLHKPVKMDKLISTAERLLAPPPATTAP